MGIIQVAKDALAGGLADQWLEVIEPGDMGDQTVFTKGVKTRAKNNKKGSEDLITDGSVVHVYDNQFMMLVDGGKVIDYTAEPGYYKVDNKAAPSLFNGQFKEALSDIFGRIKYAGQPSGKQKVFFINLQEIKGIKFGTRQPINYFDNFYNAELFLRAHGTYSIRIVNPLQFWAEAIPRNKDHVEITEINEQYLSEFLEALSSAINQMSADGIRISFVSGKARELGKYMANVLDEDWTKNRGMEVQSVGLASISYDEKSQELINKRNEGAMLSDPSIREGYVQGKFANGMEAAGSNPNGAMSGFMGMGMGMNMMGGMVGNTSQTNLEQMRMQQQAAQQSAPASTAGGWTCSCGAKNTGKFCQECGKPMPAPASSWTCSCGTSNTGKFCSNCGKPAPAAEWTCGCGTVNKGKFCSNCGKPRE